MNRILLFMYCIGHAFFLHASKDSLVLIHKIPIQTELFTTDPIGNIYVLTSNNSIIKYNKNGDSLAQFNEIKKGKISHIDATNPLRIIVYSSSFGDVFILDNMMSVKRSFSLQQLGMFSVTCVANSIDGNLWVYDPASALLLKLNEDLNIQVSVAQRQLLNEEFEPIYLVEQDRNLYAINYDSTIYKFDLYGFYQQTLGFKSKHFQAFEHQYLYFDQGFLVSYNAQSFSEKKMAIPYAEEVKNIHYENDRLYISYKDQLLIYQVYE
ncbi:MAG: hypothetical protein R2831_05485 [Chitinophagaceae bacterium]